MVRNQLSQIFVLANEFKEGDLNVGGTRDDHVRREARHALAGLLLGDIARADFVEDQVTEALHRSLDPQLAGEVAHLTVAEFKRILLSPQGASWIKRHRDGVSSEATAAVVKAAELNPTQAAQGYYNLGAVYTNRGRTKEAGDAFLKATEINPQMAQAWYQLGISYFGAPATIPDAVGVLEKFLVLQPTGPDADAAKALIEAAKASTPTGFKSERQIELDKQAAEKAEREKAAKEKATPAGKQKKQ